MNATDGRQSFIILGASTRAAAFSALRAGLQPTCADLFADLDLADRCDVSQIAGTEYPDGLELAALSAAPGPWAYVGALENHPELVERIARRRPLLGNGPKVLRRARDPFEIAAFLTRVGLPCPRVQRLGERPAPDERWLVKPCAGAGGRGVREYQVLQDVRQYSVLRTQDSESDACVSAPHSHYLQQRIDGPSCAATFVADGKRAMLLGLTRQLVGEPELHAKPFHYCGSIGPLPIDGRMQENLAQLGHVLAAEFGLLGLFGVDGILADGEFWPVEINPRYTASVEVLELALGVATMTLHRDACTRGAIPAESAAIGRRLSTEKGNMLGKAILFSSESIEVRDLSGYLRDPLDCTSRWPVPRIADVPRAGEQFAAGQPICTVFARGHSVDACRAALIGAARRLYGRLTSEAACSRIAPCQKHLF